jgi:hypothetical protein
MGYIEQKTGRPISLTSYQRYKKIALNENVAISWIDHFAKIGFVEHYHKRINEMERLQQETLWQLHLELNKNSEEQNTKYITSLIAQIRQNNIHLCQLGVGIPIIAKMRQNNEIRNQKILKLVNYNNGRAPLISSEDISHLEEIDVDAIIKDREVELKKAEDRFEKLKEDFVF